MGEHLARVGECLLHVGECLAGAEGFPLPPDEFLYRAGIPLQVVHFRRRGLDLGLRGLRSGRSRLQAVDSQRRLLDVIRWSFRRLRLAVHGLPCRRFCLLLRRPRIFSVAVPFPGRGEFFS